MYRSFGILLCFVFLFHTATRAQEKPVFEGTVLTDPILEGSLLQIRYSANGQKPSKLIPPKFSPFELQPGSNSGMSTSRFGNVVTSVFTYTYILKAPKKGTYTIPPFQAVINNQTFSSEPLEIVVDEKQDIRELIPNLDKLELSEINVFLATPSDEVYVGQQVPLDYILRATRSINQYNFIDQFKIEGIYEVELNTFDKTAHRFTEEKNPVVYKKMASLALFPQKVGTYTLGPFAFDVILEKSDRFGFPSYRSIRINSNAIELNVLPLPSKTAEGFDGMVEKINCNITPSKKTVQQGTTFPLKMRLKTFSDAKRIQKPTLNFGTAFTVYDPKRIEQSKESKGRLENTVLFDYFILAEKEGAYTIRPEFQTFNPITKSYDTVYSNPIEINVIPSGSNSDIVEDDRDSNTRLSDLAPLSSSMRNPFLVKFWGSYLFWGLLIGIPMLFIGMFYQKRKNAQKANVPRSPKELAIQKLSNQQSLHEQSSVYWDYLGSILSLNPVDRNKAMVKTKLNDQGYTPDLVSSTVALLEELEFAEFASGKLTGEYKSRIIESIEKLSR